MLTEKRDLFFLHILFMWSRMRRAARRQFLWERGIAYEPKQTKSHIIFVSYLIYDAYVLKFYFTCLHHHNPDPIYIFSVGQDVHCCVDCFWALLASLSCLLLLHLLPCGNPINDYGVVSKLIVSRQHSRRHASTQHIFLAFFWLAMANSALNPLVYFSMNAK